MENRSRNQRSGTVSTNTTSRGVGKSVLDGQTTEIGEQMGNVNMDYWEKHPHATTKTLTPGRASFFRTQDKVTRDLKTQAKMKLALGVFFQMMVFSQNW